jgi:cell division protein FtsB
VAHITQAINTSVYRPKKLPRVIKRQWPVLRLTVVISVVGLVAAAVTWRQVSFERSELEVALQRTTIESLSKELVHLKGQVEIESSYPKIAEWARQKHGWKPIQDRVRPVSIPQNQLTPSALSEARLLEAIHE